MQQLNKEVKITFTDVCKSKIIHAKGGINFALKGYAFYNGDFENDLNTIKLTDLNEDYVIYNEYKNGTTLKDKLFDMTYIPALEGKIINQTEEGDDFIGQFGTYDIALNKGLFKTLPVSFKYIILYGEELSENLKTLQSRNKFYVAAIIEYKDSYEVTETNYPKKIFLQVSLSDFTEDKLEGITPQVLIDENFDEATENETAKNLNLLEIYDNYTLTPDEKNNDYTDDVKHIKYDVLNGEDGPANTKFIPANLGILDKTEKINNNWNLSPRVFVGQKNPTDVTVPHIQLFNGDSENLNSLSIQYDTDNRYVTINQDEGIDSIQADFFPEDIDAENKICLKDKIKRSNTTVNYGDTSACESYFRFDSNESKYGNGTYRIFEFDNRGNKLECNELPTKNVSMIYSDRNTFWGNDENVVVLDSDDNTVGNGLNDLTLINTFNSNLIASKGEENEAVLNNNILIGVTGLDFNVNSTLTANNITFIGKNKNSKFVTETPSNVLEFDEIKTVKGLFNHTFNNGSDSDIISDTVQIGLSENDAFDYEQLLENQALIGFEGLTVNKVPQHEYFYPCQYEIGYSKELNQYDYYYYGEPVTSQTAHNYSVVFGNYNANHNLTGLSAAQELTISQAFAFKGVNLTFNPDTRFSSFYNKDFTYSTNKSDVIRDDPTASAYANIHRLFFNNTQDSIFAFDEYSANWASVTADEGDFSLNKIVVVGNGVNKTNIDVTGHSPAEFASKATDYNSNCRRMDLFSIEKNSFQLVHNGVYDDNPHYSATNVENIPSMFAVRGFDPVTQDYIYHYTWATSSDANNTRFIKPELYQNINQYNLHHSVYTPTGIYIPLQRSSNDLYKMAFKNVKGLIDGNVIKTNKNLNYDAIKNLKNFDQHSFVIKTKGLQVKGSDGKFITKYDFDMATIVDFYALKGIKIPMSNMNGDNTNVYTFYILNNNPRKGLNFKGFRMNKNGNSVQTLYKNKYIPKGRCVRVDYMDCATKGKYGVMNFDYWNKTRNSFYK
ncbi:MAG: hypothetical protein J6V44_04435 [Methanobrevibacter sp.]|nr:hypothetical protein [Methanobrevibacter sp.]